MADDLIYKSNPKHREPWQPGKKGALCPRAVWDKAQDLLEGSELVGSKRYATSDGLAYEAQDSNDGTWHGYPVGWERVPESLRRRWLKEKRVKRRDTTRYWSNQAASDVYDDD